ncbi:hypothetical protein COC97_14725 [Bacillus anthracis]|nr:hypothetical protein CN892_23370 [Bacillus anthracis]PGT39826.1 hypothetical protein COC97_14725 [Bacillus anthracis]
MTTENIAIFIDYDNVYVTLEKYYDKEAVTYTSDIIKKIKEQYSDNKISVFKAFADFQKINPVLTQLQMIQVELRHVYSTNQDNPNRKNASDIALTIDVMKTLFNKKDVDRFVLVSSDSDMLPLINEIKYHGKEVDVIYSDYSAGTTYKEIIEADEGQVQAPSGDNKKTLEELLALDVYEKKTNTYFTAHMSVYLEIINKMIYTTYHRYGGRGTTSKRDINKALWESNQLVRNDISLLIDHLFDSGILIETPIPGSTYTKVLINEQWFNGSQHTLSNPLITEENYKKQVSSQKK